MGGGKDAATYLKRLFSTLVLQPIVQYGVQQLMGGSGAAAGATSGGQSGLIGGGMPGGSFTDWSTLGSKAGNWLIDQSTDLAVKGFGTLSKNAFALGDTIKSVDTWLKDIPGMSGGIGSALGYAGALVSLSQGQYGSAAGAAIGTAILPGIGTMIGSTLGGLVDGLFGSSRPKSRRLGGAFSTSELDDYQVSTQLGLTDDFKKAVESRSNETLDTAVQSLVVAVTGAYNSLGKYTGDRKIGATAAFADEPSLDDRYSWAAFQLFDELSGKVLAEWNSGKALDPEGEKAFAVLSGEMSAAMVAELKASDIPGWMRTVLDSLGSEITLDGLSGAMQQIAQIDAGFMSLGKTMGMFTDLSGEMQTALLNATGGLENLVSVSGSFYESYYTEAQRMETLSAQLKSALSGLNIQLDPRMGDAAKAQFKSTVEAAFAAGNGELAAQLLNMNQSFATAAEYAAKAAEEMQKSALAILENAASGALANLEAAVNREKTYWQNIADASQTAISSLSSALGLLTSNAQALYGEVSSTQQMMAAQGMVYVENALAGVRRGASVGSFGGLQDAISAARSGISSGAYATQFERERDALVLAGQLKELGGLTETQISVEERTLRAAREQIDQLDKTLEYWQQALDFDAFQIDATLSVAEAVAALGPLISAISLERSAGSYASAITAVTPGTEGQKVALYQQMIAAGLTDAQIRAQVDKTTGVQTDRDWDYLKRLSGIPSFDVGTNFVQRDMVANIHQGERIFTAVENRDIVNAMRGGSNNSALVSAVDRLTAQNAALTDRLEAIERNTSKMPQMADQIDSSGGAAGMFNVKVIA